MLKISAEAAARTQRQQIDKIKRLLLSDRPHEAASALYMLLFNRTTLRVWELAVADGSRLPQILNYLRRIEFKNKGVPTAGVNLRTGLLVIGSKFFVDFIEDTFDIFWLLLHERNHVIIRDILDLPVPSMTHSLINFAEDAYINAVARKQIPSGMPERFYADQRILEKILAEAQKEKGEEELTEEEKQVLEERMSRLHQMLTTRSDIVSEVVREPFALTDRVKISDSLCDALVGAHHALYKDTVVGKQYFDNNPFTPNGGHYYADYGAWMKAFYEWWRKLNDEAKKQFEKVLAQLPPLVKSGSCQNQHGDYGPEFDIPGMNEGQGGEDPKEPGEEDFDPDAFEDQYDIPEQKKEDIPIKTAEDCGDDETHGNGVSHQGRDIQGHPFQSVKPCSFEHGLLSSTFDQQDDARNFGSMMSAISSTNLDKIGEVCGTILSLRSVESIMEGSTFYPPSSLSRRDLALLACGHTPVLYRFGLGITQPRLKVYMDVSGSMHAYLPYIPFISEQLKEHADRFFQFSTELVEVDADEKYYYSTGGTRYDIVAKHILRNSFRSVIIVTDETDSISPELKEQLKVNVEELYLVVTPCGWGDNSRGFTALATHLSKITDTEQCD